MAASLYLIAPQLPQLMKGGNMQIIHVVGGTRYSYIGLIFFGLLVYHHLMGVKAWSPDYRVSSKLVLFGRILAGTGWLIHEEDKMYAFAVLGTSLLMYTLAERKSGPMVKAK